MSPAALTPAPGSPSGRQRGRADAVVRCFLAHALLTRAPPPNPPPWDTLAGCVILSHVSNEHMDAYVLSESSLFVYKHKCFLKTCGTTTLLRCLPALLDAARAEGLELEWLGYSRKDFTFPTDQVFPHTSFSQEVSYADGCVGPHGKPLDGGASHPPHTLIRIASATESR